MKRLIILLLTVLCLAGCEKDKELSAEVVQVGLEPNSHSYLVIQTESNRETTVTFDDATAVISFVEDTETVEPGDTVRIVLDEEKKYGATHARTILVESRLVEDGAVLADGTALDIVEYGSHRIYRLKDGTELLDERNPSGPEHVYTGVVCFDDLPEAAQEKVAAYFDEKGLFYDIPQELEMAYQAYLAENGEYSCRLVSQDITPMGANEKIISFATVVTLPLEGWGSVQFREGAIFDRGTGERIETEDLFVCDMEEALAELLDRNGIAEPERSEMLAAFRPECVLLSQGYLEIEFPYGTLSDQKNGGTILSYEMEDVKDLLQPWAVIEQ